jgi:CheY-like chemotaxis protein
MTSHSLTTILLIDADDHDRSYYAHQLNIRCSDYRVIQAKDGRAGLELYDAQPIDCIVMELDLPDISGFKLLLKLVPPGSVPNVPVVILASVVLPAVSQFAKQNGAQACLMKQFTSGDDLEQVIRKAITKIVLPWKEDPPN